MLSAALSNAAVMHLFPEPGSLVRHLMILRLKPAMTNRFVAADICGGEMFLGIRD